MKVSMWLSGGVAGIAKRTTVDADCLPPEEGQRLRQLIADADFQAGEPRGAGGRPDVRVFRIVVEDERGQTTYVVDESQATEKTREVLRHLEACAEIVKRHP